MNEDYKSIGQTEIETLLKLENDLVKYKARISSIETLQPILMQFLDMWGAADIEAINTIYPNVFSKTPMLVATLQGILRRAYLRGYMICDEKWKKNLSNGIAPYDDSNYPVVPEDFI